MEAKNHTKSSLVILFMLVTISCQQVKHNQDKLRLFYNQPAEEWTEALPVGNGFLGSMVYGSVGKEHIWINEETLWTGRPNDYSNKGASDYLDKIRGLLFEGKQREATGLAQREFLSIPIRQMAYQPFGDLYIEFPGHSDYTDYRRELDLTNSVSKTSYKIDNVEYQREIIASYPQRVIAINLLSKKERRNIMNRREFSKMVAAGSLGIGFSPITICNTAILQAQDNPDPQNRRGKHYLPETDSHYRETSGYIEEDPVPEYTWASEKAYEDFRDMKYGVRIHWGLYSIKRMKKEFWGVLNKPNNEKQAYFDMYKTWNPVGFNADEWMDFFVESGLKMFAFTTKHHDGFSMFDTKTRVKRRVNWIAPNGPVIEDCDLAYSIMETPFKRDVVKELTDAAHKRGVKIDLYFSQNDWHDADFRPYVWHPLQVPSSAILARRGLNPEVIDGRDPRFGSAGPLIVPDPTPEEVDRMVKRHRTQLTELLTNYGKIDMVCFDMWLGPSVWPQLRETLLQLRKIQPDVMFRARGIGNYGDYYTPEGFVPGSKENSDVPWFVIYPLGSTFAYEWDPEKFKGAKWIIQTLIDCAAKGGNFMVAIGPDGNGEFHPTAVEQIRQAGKWLKTNGEAIYGTRAREADLWKESDNVRFTRTKDNKIIYVHCNEWPDDKLVLKTVEAETNTKIYLLGNESPLKWKYDSKEGLIISTPERLKKSIPENERLAFTFRIEPK